VRRYYFIISYNNYVQTVFIFRFHWIRINSHFVKPFIDFLQLLNSEKKNIIKNIAKGLKFTIIQKSEKVVVLTAF